MTSRASWWEGRGGSIKKWGNCLIGDQEQDSPWCLESPEGRIRETLREEWHSEIHQQKAHTEKPRALWVKEHIGIKGKEKRKKNKVLEIKPCL